MDVPVVVVREVGRLVGGKEGFARAATEGILGWSCALMVNKGTR
jgi:hypothetical protein